MEINRGFPCNPANYGRRGTQSIRYIVIHYVGASGGAKNNAVYYGRDKVQASAHYFVGHASEGAAVYASVAENDTAWHCGRSDGKYVHPECRNANSIGIELCCHQDKVGKWYFDPETVERAAELTRMLMGKYHIDASHVLRHHDVTGKICPAPFVNDLDAWLNFKKKLTTDPLVDKAASLEAAVDKLAERGVMSNPEYWKGGSYSAENVKALIIKCAAAI